MNDFTAWAMRWHIPAPALEELRILSIPPAAAGRGDFRAAASSVGAMLLRNNSGVAYNPGGRPVRFGLGNDSAKLNAIFKSSDWIGFTRNGRFAAIEEKPIGWKFKGDEHETAQKNFLDTVNRHGGVGIFAQSPEQICNALKS